MTEKNRVTTKVSVTISENFEDIMILMNASFSEIIKEDEHFFEDLGRELDIKFRKDDNND